MEPILLKPPDGLPTAPSLLGNESGDGAEAGQLGPILLPAATSESELSGGEARPAADEAESEAECREAQAGAEPVPLGTPRGWWRRIADGVRWLCSRAFGAVSLIVGLSFLAAYPVVQVFSLGYLLEAAGRIGRSGRLRDAFPLVPQAARLGGMSLGVWLMLLPWRFAHHLRDDAALIDPASPQTLFLNRLLGILLFVIPLHILFALLRGGRIRYFFWPFNFVWFLRRVRQGGYFEQAWRNCRSMLQELRVLHFFYLGLRGGIGAFIWLAIPSTLYAIGRSKETALLAILGGLMLAVVVIYVPFLQVQFAAENRFRAIFELGTVRERFRRAPIAFWISLVFTLLLAIPLYLLKIEVVPRDALWLPSLVFILTIFPLKVMTGWAYGRAGRKEKRAHWTVRCGCRLFMIPVALFYAIVVFFTQYTGWHGVRALFEHHAFLLPVPF